MLFGGGSTVAPWMNTPRVEIHGPGRSKVIIHEGDAEQLGAVSRPYCRIGRQKWR